jgi:hypothetical protein
MLTGTLTAQTALDGGRKLTTTLSGAAERPGPGDPDGAGTATLTVNPGQNRICYELTVTNIATATAAHIHEGAADVAGPVRVTLSAPADGDSSGCVDVTRERALDILKDPGDYYVNVHNAAFPGGAVRGQLAKK